MNGELWKESKLYDVLIRKLIGSMRRCWKPRQDLYLYKTCNNLFEAYDNLHEPCNELSESLQNLHKACQNLQIARDTCESL